MKIQSLYKNKSLSNMFDNLLDKFEAKSVTKRESYSLARGAFDKVKKQASTIMEIDKSTIVVATKDAYEKIAEVANEYPENKGILNLAFHFKSKYESDPNGYLTMAQIEDIRKYADRILPKRLFAKSSSLIHDAISDMIKSSVKNRFDFRKLDKIASDITSQDQFDIAMEANGFSLDRPDMEQIREYIAYKVSTNIGSELTTDSFKSSEKVKRTMESLRGKGEFNTDTIKAAFNEDWKTIIQEKKANSAQFEGVMSDYQDNSKLSLEDALAQNDVVHLFDTKTSNTYIVRKDMFGGFNLYSSKHGSSDAILLDKYTTIEDLKNDVSVLPNLWSV